MSTGNGYWEEGFGEEESSNHLGDDAEESLSSPGEGSPESIQAGYGGYNASVPKDEAPTTTRTSTRRKRRNNAQTRRTRANNQTQQSYNNKKSYEKHIFPVRRYLIVLEG